MPPHQHPSNGSIVVDQIVNRKPGDQLGSFLCFTLTLISSFRVATFVQLCHFGANCVNPYDPLRLFNSFYHVTIEPKVMGGWRLRREDSFSWCLLHCCVDLLFGYRGLVSGI